MPSSGGLCLDPGRWPRSIANDTQAKSSDRKRLHGDHRRGQAQGLWVCFQDDVTRYGSSCTLTVQHPPDTGSACTCAIPSFRCPRMPLPWHPRPQSAGEHRLRELPWRRPRVLNPEHGHATVRYQTFRTSQLIPTVRYASAGDDPCMDFAVSKSHQCDIDQKHQTIQAARTHCRAVRHRPPISNRTDEQHCASQRPGASTGTQHQQRATTLRQTSICTFMASQLQMPRLPVPCMHRVHTCACAEAAALRAVAKFARNGILCHAMPQQPGHPMSCNATATRARDQRYPSSQAAAARRQPAPPLSGPCERRRLPMSRGQSARVPNTVQQCRICNRYGSQQDTILSFLRGWPCMPASAISRARRTWPTAHDVSATCLHVSLDTQLWRRARWRAVNPGQQHPSRWSMLRHHYSFFHKNSEEAPRQKWTSTTGLVPLPSTRSGLPPTFMPSWPYTQSTPSPLAHMHMRPQPAAPEQWGRLSCCSCPPTRAASTRTTPQTFATRSRASLRPDDRPVGRQAFRAQCQNCVHWAAQPHGALLLHPSRLPLNSGAWHSWPLAAACSTAATAVAAAAAGDNGDHQSPVAPCSAARPALSSHYSLGTRCPLPLAAAARP